MQVPAHAWPWAVWCLAGGLSSLSARGPGILRTVPAVGWLPVPHGLPVGSSSFARLVAPGAFPEPPEPVPAPEALAWLSSLPASARGPQKSFLGSPFFWASILHVPRRRKESWGVHGSPGASSGGLFLRAPHVQDGGGRAGLGFCPFTCFSDAEDSASTGVHPMGAHSAHFTPRSPGAHSCCGCERAQGWDTA